LIVGNLATVKNTRSLMNIRQLRVLSSLQLQLDHRLFHNSLLVWLILHGLSHGF